MNLPVTRAAIEHMYTVIAPQIRRTPVVEVAGRDLGVAPQRVTHKMMQAPDIDTVIVAVGGGGLIGGVAAWCAGAVRVVGVEPEGAPTLTEALRAGRLVDAPTGSIAADSLAPRRVGDLMFPIARAHVERVVLVSDGAIRAAQSTLWEGLRVVAEPGGAAAFAALQSGAYVPARDERVAVVISGGNTELSTLNAHL